MITGKIEACPNKTKNNNCFMINWDSSTLPTGLNPSMLNCAILSTNETKELSQAACVRYDQANATAGILVANLTTPRPASTQEQNSNTTSIHNSNALRTSATTISSGTRNNSASGNTRRVRRSTATVDDIDSDDDLGLDEDLNETAAAAAM